MRSSPFDRMLDRLETRRREYAVRIVDLRYDAQCSHRTLTAGERTYMRGEWLRMARLDDEIDGWLRFKHGLVPPESRAARPSPFAPITYYPPW